MQETTIQSEPATLPPAVHLAVAALVGLVLAGILAVASSASHTAVRQMSAQLQDTARHVTLPPVAVIGRRVWAIDAPAANSARRAPGRDASRPEAG